MKALSSQAFPIHENNRIPLQYANHVFIDRRSVICARRVVVIFIFRQMHSRSFPRRRCGYTVGHIGAPYLHYASAHLLVNPRASSPPYQRGLTVCRPSTKGGLCSMELGGWVYHCGRTFPVGHAHLLAHILESFLEHMYVAWMC